MTTGYSQTEIYTQTHIVDPEEAQSDHVGAPFGPGAARAAAGRDAAAVEHDGHVVGSFRLAGLTGHHCSTKMEACTTNTNSTYSYLQ